MSFYILFIFFSFHFLSHFLLIQIIGEKTYFSFHFLSFYFLSSHFLFTSKQSVCACLVSLGGRNSKPLLTKTTLEFENLHWKAHFFRSPLKPNKLKSWFKRCKWSFNSVQHVWRSHIEWHFNIQSQTMSRNEKNCFHITPKLCLTNYKINTLNIHVL